MGSILSEQDVNYFLKEIENNFPNFVAGVITDRHGFPIASKIPENFHINETELALSAISAEKDFINDSKLIKVKRDLDKAKNIKLLFLLKSKGYINHFKNLKKIIARQKFF